MQRTVIIFRIDWFQLNIICCSWLVLLTWINTLRCWLLSLHLYVAFQSRTRLMKGLHSLFELLNKMHAVYTQIIFNILRSDRKSSHAPSRQHRCHGYLWRGQEADRFGVRKWSMMFMGMNMNMTGCDSSDLYT